MIREEIKTILLDNFGPEVIPEDLRNNEPLFGMESRLGLDSIDALNFILALEKRFGVKFDEGKEKTSRALRTIDSISEYVGAK
jgi:acyl carrier protein